jgi:hypothetical protein
VAPAIRRQRDDVLARLLPKLRALDVLVEELISVERTAGNFVLLVGGAHIAPTQSAIGAEIGPEMKMRVAAWMATIGRVSGLT